MALLSPSTFRERVRSLDRDAFAAFVADLWRARGFDVTVEDGVVVASRTGEGGARELIVVAPDAGQAVGDGTPAPPGVDVVVSRADDPDVAVGPWAAESRLLGCDALREMLLYAVPRTDADALVRRHLDCELVAEARTDSSPTASAAVATRSTWLAIAGALLVVVLVTAAALGVPSVGSQQSGGAAGTGATSSPAPTPGPGTAVGSSGSLVIPCLDTPEEAVQYQLRALGGDEGVRTVWGFGTHEFRRYAGTYRAFNRSMHSHPFEHLLDPGTVSTEATARSAGTARETVTVTDDGVRYSYVFTLTSVDGNGEGCWRTDGLTYQQSK